MPKTALPPDERARLDALNALRVLDTAPEPAFDELARLVAHVLRAPYAAVSLIDARRQWLKAGVGLVPGRSFPRDVTFCTHVVTDDAPLIVEDASEDPRFAANPYVAGDPQFRFYVGMPIRNERGLVLGTVCALDLTPRTVTATELEALGLLARQVMDQLEARRARAELEEQRVRAEAAARRLQSLFAALVEGVVVQRQDGAITEVNEAAERILGLTSDQLRGRSSLDPRWRAVREDGSPFPGDQHPAMQALRTGQPVMGTVMGVHKPDGTLSWITIHAVPRFDADGNVVESVTTFHDVTAIRSAAARALAQERLASIGTLAAGIGHEINNPLVYVLGNLEMAIEDLDDLAGASSSGRLRELQDVLRDAREGAERIGRIVRGLRALVREEVMLQGVNVAQTLQTSLSMAAHELRHRATVTQEGLDGLVVMADESRLTQVFVNLLVNAAQAFRAADPARNRIRVSMRRLPHERVEIAVQDNGPGIPPHVLARIFDPFFTTKPVGQGTGLGLTVCRTLLASLQGEITVDSDEERGTVFYLTLPLAPAIAEVAPSAREPGGPRGRVLVVDDDTSVGATLQRMLAREHDVVVTDDPNRALMLLLQGERFDAVLCDVVMPRLSGEELFRMATATRADLADRFVFITGGTTDAAVRAFLDEVPNDRLEKPFSTQSLLSLVRRYVRRPVKASLAP